MAGKPKEARLLAALEKRAVRELGDGATPLDFVCDYISGGKTFIDLAGELATELGESVSRQFISGTANALAPDAKARITVARQEGAMALAEDTLSIADDAEPTAGGAAKARVQIGSRQWLAERFNSAQFGGMKGQVNVSFGALMLEALRQPPPIRPVVENVPLLLTGTTEDAGPA